MEIEREKNALLSVVRKIGTLDESIRMVTHTKRVYQKTSKCGDIWIRILRVQIFATQTVKQLRE